MKAWREECAVFGIWGDKEAGKMAYLGLYAQQHRGQEATGIVNLQDDGRHWVHKGFGLVGEVFDQDNLDKMSGRAAIGHVRYSTTGENHINNIQPLAANLATGSVALAHNGNIVNSNLLKDQLKMEGAIFQGTNDTECILHMLARHPSKDPIICLKDVLPQLEGAFSMVTMTQKRLIACRDPWGFRPLVLGRRKQAEGRDAVVIASESCAFDLIGATYEREIAPGEIFWVDDEGEHSEFFAEAKAPTAFCVFEHVYFSRPDSIVFGESVYEARKAMGRKLATENPVDADLVIPVPDSGVPAAIGYANESGIAFELGIIRNHYIGRTFIQPSQSIRSFGVKIKLNPQSALLKGKKVVVIDDSLVRGTTSQKIIRLVRQAGAREVHFRIASPPTTGACYYGVDTPKREQLIASTKSLEEIRSFIDADSLAYLTVEGMMEAVGGKKTGYCAACFNGEYPTSLF